MVGLVLGALEGEHGTHGSHPQSGCKEGTSIARTRHTIAGDTLAGDRLAHLLCRSLMTRLSSPSPDMAVPWGSAKAGAAMRVARLTLTWHP